MCEKDQSNTNYDRIKKAIELIESVIKKENRMPVLIELIESKARLIKVQGM